MSEIVVRNAYQTDWDEAMKLAWNTFMKFDAPDYSKEGIINFNKFINDEMLYKMFVLGSYQLFVAEEDKRIVGMLSLREKKHISLLFVDVDHLQQGIAKSLMRFVADYARNEEGVERLTVNSSPYAVGFYHKQGFTDLDGEVRADGIRYVPMELKL